MNTKTESRMLIAVAVLAALALICIAIFLPWSVSFACQSPGPCEPQSHLNFVKVGAIVVLGAVAVGTLIAGLNSE